jgi:hypothetical protein
MLTRNYQLRFLNVAVVALGIVSTTCAEEALPSWNDGPAKQAILEFVKTTTTQGSPQFVPPEERVATFDQDGTLWVEHPIYTQVMYCPGEGSGPGQGEARTGKCRAVQHRPGTAPRRSRGDGEADIARHREDRHCHADWHAGRDVSG